MPAQIEKQISAPPAIGTQPVQPGQWVQTDRSSHQAWGRLNLRHPAAGAVLHELISFMGNKNAVVIGQRVLAERLGVHLNTVANALKVLCAGNWVQAVRLGKGREAAYVVNSRVAWGEKRENLRLSAFSAVVVADYADQNALTLDSAPLRKIPALFQHERQLPSGDGEPPPSQPHIEGLEPDLPALKAYDEGYPVTLEAIQELRDGKGHRCTLEQMKEMIDAA